MRGRLSFLHALVILALALVAVWVPFAVGNVFGLGAVVVTPIVMVFVLFGFGAVLAAMAPTGRWIRVAFATFVTAGVYAVLLGMPQNPNPVMQMYIILPAAAGPTFADALANVLKARGIAADVSQSRPYNDEAWRIAHRLEATTGLTWIWSSNTTMTGGDGRGPDPGCIPAGGDPRPDPAQYFILVKSWAPCRGEKDAAVFFDDLRRELVARGYDVRDKSVPCAAEESAPKR